MKPASYGFRIQEVAQACKTAATELLRDLPSQVSSRLRLQRVVQRHGTEVRMFLYHIWDVHQPSLLDYHHFSYGFVYDPVRRYHPSPLLVRFYANKHKIYDKRESIIPVLWQEMLVAQKVLYGYRAAENDQMIALLRFFTADTFDALQTQVYQGLLELIPYWHARYSAVIDNYGVTLTRAEVRAVMSGRKKVQPTRPRPVVDQREAYCRHVPPRLREKVFDRDGWKCVKCSKTTNLHADHILPVALGGLTVIENLQTMCAAHNLSKGHRESRDYRLRL